MRQNYLDVLKAFAIIAVVFYHYGLLLNGYLGVDLFLVIAGYLTTKSLYKKIIIPQSTTKGGWVFAEFELGRIARLLPTLILAGIVCMSVGFFVMIDDTYESLSQSVIATNFFGNNVIELIATGDYWAADKQFSPLMHTWYVGLLMQFYIVFPLLFLAAQLDKKSPQKALLTLLVSLSFISLILFLGEQDTARRFYLLPYRFFEFGIGGIAALLYKPEEHKSVYGGGIYICYALLLLLFVLNIEIFPANLKLLAVTALSVVLICSNDVLDNKIAGNYYVAKIGSASYSIFVWHQIIFAFYRSCFGSHMGFPQLAITLLLTVVLSWLSYSLIEQKTGLLLKSKSGKRKLFYAYGSLFVLLTAFTFVVYRNAGVVRDIPELEVSKANIQRGRWAQYNERIRTWDRSFETNKKHWFVIGNSYARDFINIINESSLAQNVELVYCDASSGNYKNIKYDKQYQDADKIFVASKDFSEEMVHEVELRALAFGHALNDVIIVGEKDFGETMTQVFIHRYENNYFKCTVQMKPGLEERNNYFKRLYGDRYIDMIEIISVGDGKVRVFTDDNMFISSDCTHLTRSGAIFFAKRINLDKYLSIPTKNENSN